MTTGGSATLSGQGTAPTIDGAGTVSPGTSPGILTSQSVSPALGLDFALEFTAVGSPDFAAAGASVNDVLHLRSAAPFAAPLNGDNTVGVYFDMDDVFGTQKFRGGFCTDDGSADFLAGIQGASFEYFIRTAGVTPYELNGVYYQPLAEYDPRLSFNVATAAEIADFADGDVAGRVMQLSAVVPEPATLLIWSLLAGLGVGMGWRRRRK